MIPPLVISIAPTTEPWETLTLSKGARAYWIIWSCHTSLAELVLISSLPCMSNIGYLQLYLEIHSSESELHLYIKASLSAPVSLIHPLFKSPH